ncbi:holo-[acyl-carrier-protein] synthase [Clostridium acetireducens DSM 10703]|jgi:holo-[acyl-carrier protein] synthase|uniref:Holo-[acyl-carrier-protein] synthase n=1 Tax=Clostridium acetireducens DSM 10703 TaxID=1121290 RepID=A0A1E8F1P5_9CLOT|nr:holo-ACP synthase [Clostridium acetireducens]OFI07512.1 holo-[acyl-carrier-protein] synthase [Clostridium acetireducens DSM 10703]
MIAGIGVDIVDINRIRKAMEKNHNFVLKILNNIENTKPYTKNKYEFIAARFAAKEAVAKALGTGFVGFSFKDIIIKNNSSGMPYIILEGQAKKLAEKYGYYKIHLSISHERDYAIAYVIWEVDKIENNII